MKRQILVFVVRHGEREDEAERERGPHRKVSREDKIDPNLTEEGYRQAAATFDSLLAALASARVGKVAVFTSPLRRAVGTAMMLSSSVGKVEADWVKNNLKESQDGEDDGYSGVKFILPANSDMKKREGNKSTFDQPNTISTCPNTCIPIVVHNGLCDCTALVARLGGHKNLIRAGVLSCAAKSSNSIRCPENTMHVTLEGIKTRALDAINDKLEDGCTPASVQFVKVEDNAPADDLSRSSSLFVPMAAPVCLVRHHPNNSTEDDEQREDTWPRYEYEVRDKSPIDQVVRMSMHAGCEACIVSSHREEIRELYKQKCGFRHRKSIPYCCLGVFEAIADDGGTHETESLPLHWILHDVIAPNEMLVQRVCEIIQSNEIPPVLSSPFVISYPVIERTTLHLCEASLILDDQAAEQSLISIKKCLLTGVSPSVEEPPPKTFALNLLIVQGHGSWLKFLERMQDDVAHGTIELIHSRSTLALTRCAVLVRPEKQPFLPYPPKTIEIEVIY